MSTRDADDDVPVQDVQYVGLEQEPGEPWLILELTNENDEEYRFRFSADAEEVLLRRIQERAAQPAK